MKENYLKISVLVLTILFSLSTFSQTCITTITDANGPAAVCGGTIATLTATHNGDNVYWYNAATDGTLLHTGTPYQTVPLTANTSFWAESRKQILGATASGGAKPTRSSSSGTSVVTATSPWGLVFNATQSFILNSVDVFLTSATTGTLVLNLKDSNLNVLETLTVETPGGGSTSSPAQFTVPLGFTIPVGTGYRLVAVSSPAMVRDTGSNAYPFSLGTVGSVTQGTINNSLTSNPGVYYFFYNWNYTPIIACTSAREEVSVLVNTTNAPTGASQQLFTLGETIADLDVTGTDLVWYSDAAGTLQIPTTTLLTEGTTYYVKQTLNGCSSSLLAVTARTVLGVESKVFADLKYYPNPVNNRFVLSNLENNSLIETYTIFGQKIVGENYNSTEAILDFSGFSKGTYMVKITSGGYTKTIKVLKN